ncbi:50S ribosomal protein L18 [Candidatus Curtissbacteria bacterium]|nr:50S ribosomal protein L18 [Candidatus Curtissbacteria bacterium]
MSKVTTRAARKFRIRKKVSGTTSVPRLSVYRSNLYIYAQLIDDQSSKTITAASDIKLAKNKDAQTKIQRAFTVGETLAANAVKNKVKKVVFDRSGYKYHGRVKSLAEGARKGGLEF